MVGLTIFLILMGFFAGSFAGTYSFDYATIDNTVNVGEDNTSVAIDSMGNPGDVDEDILVYDFEIYRDVNFTQLVTSADSEGGSSGSLGGGSSVQNAMGMARGCTLQVSDNGNVNYSSIVIFLSVLILLGVLRRLVLVCS